MEESKTQVSRGWVVASWKRQDFQMPGQRLEEARAAARASEPGSECVLYVRVCVCARVRMPMRALWT